MAEPSREEAFSLLREYNKNEGLIKHALAVEAVMRYCARKRGQDEEKWGIMPQERGDSDLSWLAG